MKRFLRLLTVLSVVALFLCCILAGCDKPTEPATTEQTTEVNTQVDTEPGTEVDTEPSTQVDTEATTKTNTDKTTANNGKKDGYQADQKYLFGVGYVHYSMGLKATMEEVTGTIQALGAKSVRSWSNCYLVMDDYKTINKDKAAEYHKLYAEMRKKGVEQIIAVSHYWYTPGKESIATMDIPKRDMTPGSDYMKFLDMYYQTFKALAAEFPEVDGWEMGNEFNHDPFLHPMGYGTDPSVKPYTIEEKAEITTDMMFYAAKGIHEGNKKALAIMPAIAPVDGINGEKSTEYLYCIYDNIYSNRFGTTDTYKFFDALAWHPYYSACPDELFVLQNNALHDIAVENGDGNKKVFLTEAGFADGGNAATDYKHYDWVLAMYDLIAAEMPYVEACHYYRLFDDGADLYGLMNEPCKGFTAKEKGKAYQEAAGGKGDLDQYAVDFSKYKAGDNVAFRIPAKASSAYEHVDWGLATCGLNDGLSSIVGWCNNGGGDAGAKSPDTTEWVQFEFPELVDVDKVTLFSLRNVNDANSHKVQGVPRAWYVEVSENGSEWEKVAEYTVNEKDLTVYPAGTARVNDNLQFSVSFPKKTARCVRITFTKLDPDWIYNPGNYFVQLQEVEIYKAK